ncbi:MAG: MBOAT family protein [Rhizobacter sp.]|nr:MBOAT family protein [Chlorobiales bacterium]
MLETLKDIFLFDQESPLIFTQLFFWGFFAVVMAIYSVVYKNQAWRNTYLFFISVFFYYKTSGLFVLLLLIATLVNFTTGLAIFVVKEKWQRKSILTFAVVLNLTVLAYFKYAYFFTESFNAFFHTDYAVFNYFAQWSNTVAGTHFSLDHVLLPIGLSFYTFQKISYNIDIYRGELKPISNFLDFGFFVFFFPQLVAGPIVRATLFAPQLQKEYDLTKQEFGIAVFWILNGLLKKMVISDYLSVNFVDRIFSNPNAYTGFESVMACYAYSMQVYCDFSGYTDIAIGLSLLMGFRLTPNFNSPYKAQSTAEFWQRWHISLSTWLRDYLYIPIGGNKKGEVRTNFNLMITMLLGGLWHGASWNFVIWGGLNGLGLLFYRYWRRISPFKNDERVPVKIIAILITLTFITFTRIFFRADTMQIAFDMMNKIAFDMQWALAPQIVWSYRLVFGVMLIGYAVHWLPTSWKQTYRGWFVDSPVYAKAAVATVAVFIIYQALSSDLQPFIYFRF